MGAESIQESVESTQGPMQYVDADLENFLTDNVEEIVSFIF